jgi:hypothetical protein
MTLLYHNDALSMVFSWRQHNVRDCLWWYASIQMQGVCHIADTIEPIEEVLSNAQVELV